MQNINILIQKGFQSVEVQMRYKICFFSLFEIQNVLEINFPLKNSGLLIGVNF